MHVADSYRKAVETALKDGPDGLKLVLGVYNRLLRKDQAGTLEGDEIMRLAVLREVTKQKS